MDKLMTFKIILLFTVLQLTNCSPIKRNWVNEVKKESIILNDTNPEYRGGPDIVEGDIKLTPVQAAIFKESGWDGLVKSEAWIKYSREDYKDWPRYIPYETHTLKQTAEDALDRSMKEIEDFTCLRFIPRNGEHDYMVFLDSNGRCYSAEVGRISGSNRISLGETCANNSLTPAHLIMHALGRWNEEQRRDRDYYLTFSRGSIDTYAGLTKMPKADTMGIPYDYLSIMHMKTIWHANQPDEIIVSPTEYNAKFGQQQRLSMRDILHINRKFCPERAVRLVGGGSKGVRAGRVEIYWDGQWAPLCSNKFDFKAANVTCRYLGFPGEVTAYGKYNRRRTTGSAFFDNMSCQGTEKHPFACSMSKLAAINNCPGDILAYVECQSNIRLTGGFYSTAGRVEVNINGQWGTVCKNKFDNREAKVICRQLGKPYRNAWAYGIENVGGSGSIFMSELECNGDEQQLTHCKMKHTGDHLCTHSQDAYVQCR